MINNLKNEILSKSSQERAEKSLRYFKTGKGQYGEGDIFLGVSNPHLRIIVKPYIITLNLKDTKNLLKSKEHEFRLAALLILVGKYQKYPEQRGEIVEIYCSNTKFINNWDLVDLSAHCILGPWLANKDRTILYEFAKSEDLWKQRISIMSTFHFIKREREFDDTFKIAEILLDHKEDLIHKAVGWMLREIGNISRIKEEEFLKKYYKNMPRTMLRYAIEKFPEDLRQDYLKGRV